MYNERDDDTYIQTTTIHDAVNDGLDVDIEALKRLVPDPDVWAMEYEANFADEYGAFIDLSLLEYSDDIPQQKAAYVGFDIARSGDKSAIVDVVQLADSSYFVRDIVMLSNTKYD